MTEELIDGKEKISLFSKNGKRDYEFKNDEEELDFVRFRDWIIYHAFGNLENDQLPRFSDVASKVFTHHKPILLFFREEGTETEAESELLKAYKDFEYSNLFVAVLDDSGELEGHIKSLIGISRNDFPCLWLLDLGTINEISPKRYKFDVEITVENLRRFVGLFRNDQL